MEMTRAKTERQTGNRALVLGFLVAALMAASLMLTAKPAHAADFTVTSANGFGQGTLDQAIRAANDNPGADTIKFNIPQGEGGPVRVISSSFGMPAITDPVTIDGYSQPGSRPNSRQTGGTNAVILIEISGAEAGSTAGLSIRTSNVVVRGLAINRFGAQAGIDIVSGEGSKIEGNFIGTDASGTLDRGNNRGVLIRSEAGGNHAIGGASPDKRNLISGNNNGAAVSVGGSGGNKVQGNLVGVQKDGSSLLSNTSDGVALNSSNNTVGGLEPGAANVIAFNFGEGVSVGSEDNPIGNRILNNSIFGNSGLGIDLLVDDGGEGADNGVTPNDPRDPDTGPNNLQNFPVVTSAEKASGGKTTIAGKLDSTPSTKKKKSSFTVQFFSNPRNGDEGKTFLGQKKVTTNQKGKASFSFETSQPLNTGENITATATDASGNTSEFSAPRFVESSISGAP
jgi:hypothetical protein